MSAKQGQDFGGFYAQQVQFNPGQSEANWKLRIFDDGIFEKEEVFQIELEEPVFAVLEQPMVAEVTIFDNEDGMIYNRQILISLIWISFIEFLSVYLMIHCNICKFLILKIIASRLSEIL